MNKITVVDARMGRGKSSAAIRYMNEHKDTHRFLYITPYLSEVSRICDECDFDQADSDTMSKSTKLKIMLRTGHNISATHSLFYLMDEETLGIVGEMGYSLIIDESINVIDKVLITEKDFKVVTEQLSTIDEDGYVHWIDSEYSGLFTPYKEMADTHSLVRLDSALINVLNPDMLRAFREVFMLTYLLEGQFQYGYLKAFGFDFTIVGVEKDASGFKFSDKPDDPDPIDYFKLIHVCDNQKLNSAGDARTALAKGWFTRRAYDDPEVAALRNGMRNFFERVTVNGSSNTRLWTCYKENMSRLLQKNSNRFKSSFLQVSARATNEFRDRTHLAYMTNRFADPNLIKYFSMNGVVIDQEKYALSEMLQWIWRSAVRDGKPIDLYVPSKRMRSMLISWMYDQSGVEE